MNKMIAVMAGVYLAIALVIGVTAYKVVELVVNAYVQANQHCKCLEG